MKSGLAVKWIGTEGERSPITKGETRRCGAFVGSWLGGLRAKRALAVGGIEHGVRMASGVKRREGKGESEETGHGTRAMKASEGGWSFVATRALEG